MKILYLTTVLPYNKKTGGEIASSQCIEALRIKHEVDVIGYKRSNEIIELSRNDFSVEERIIESKNSKFWTVFWLFLSILNMRSYSSQKYYSKKYIRSVENLISINLYDLIIIEHSQLSWISNEVSINIPIIFNSQNVEYLLYKELSNSSNFLSRTIYLREAKLMEIEELTLLNKSNEIWVLSNSDKNEYNKLAKNLRIRVIDIPGGFKNNISLEKKYDIGILGTWSWESNKKGLEWFLNKVLPLINSTYKVALGGKGSLNYQNLYNNVEALGFVDNAQIFLSSCRVIVIPTTAGGGIQIKTLDAISTNCPIVTTTIGVRGIESLPKSIFVKDSEIDFANKINELLLEKENYESGFSWSEKRRKSFILELNNYIEGIE